MKKVGSAEIQFRGEKIMAAVEGRELWSQRKARERERSTQGNTKENFSAKPLA